MWWLAHGEHEVPSTRDWLTAHERDHVTSIRFTKRRDEFLTRRWTAKQGVASVLGLDGSPSSLARIEVGHRPSGAPYALVDGTVADVEVSISDRAGWAVCLVGTPGAAGDRIGGVDPIRKVGIDLEIVEPRTPGFVADFFTAHERAWVDAAPDDDRRHEAANLIWSAKEAALKVRQVGLRADTRSVEVHLHGSRRTDGWSSLSVVDAEGEMHGWWRRDGVFVSTIAFDVPHEPPRTLATSARLIDAAPRHSWLDRPTC